LLRWAVYIEGSEGQGWERGGSLASLRGGCNAAVPFPLAPISPLVRAREAPTKEASLEERKSLGFIRRGSLPFVNHFHSRRDVGGRGA